MSFGVVFAFLAGAACAPSGDWNGVWRGARSYDSAHETAPGVAYTLAQVELKIDGNQYQLVEGSIPRTGTVSGDARNLTLTVQTIAQHKAPTKVDAQLTRISADECELKSLIGVDPTPIRLKRVR